METVRFFMKYDGFFELLLGFVLIFVGNAIINLFKSGKKAPPLLRFVLCTSFTYGVSTVREIIQFFVDYYNLDTELQAYNYVPDKNMLFFKIFGEGAAQTGQYHLMDTDLDFLCMLIGCAVGGAVLYVLSAKKLKSKSLKVNENDTKVEEICTK